MELLHQTEINLNLFLQSLGSWLALPMAGFSLLGVEEFYMLFMPLLYWCVDSALGLRMGIMLMLSSGINDSLKVAFHSPRPYWVDQRVIAYTHETSFGIPSGHAQNAASLWGLLAASLRRRWLTLLLLLITLLISLSRLYLGVHFASDVLAGLLIGSLLLLGYLKLEKTVLGWFCSLALGKQIGLLLTASLLLLIVILAPIALLSNWQLPQPWIQTALAAAPGEPIQPLNPAGGFNIAGTWFGMTAGAVFLWKHGGFSTNGSVRQRVLRYLLGLIGILILWFGLGAVLPRSPAILGYCLRYLRYALVGSWVSLFAPRLFIQLKLAKQASLSGEAA